MRVFFRTSKRFGSPLRGLKARFCIMLVPRLLSTAIPYPAKSHGRSGAPAASVERILVAQRIKDVDRQFRSSEIPHCCPSGALGLGRLPRFLQHAEFLQLAGRTRNTILNASIEIIPIANSGSETSGVSHWTSRQLEIEH